MPCVNYLLHIQSEMILKQELSSMEAIDEQKAQEDGEPSVATEKGAFR